MNSELSKNAQEKMHELQNLEQGVSNLLLQKQAFTLESNETANALQEVKKTSDVIYRVLGTVMIKAEKESVIKELEERRKILDLRLQSIEKQEKLLETKANELRKSVQEDLLPKKK